MRIKFGLIVDLFADHKISRHFGFFRFYSKEAMRVYVRYTRYGFLVLPMIIRFNGVWVR
jgi:hypothetical protein